jgi:hypothetical protein
MEEINCKNCNCVYLRAASLFSFLDTDSPVEILKRIEGNGDTAKKTRSQLLFKFIEFGGRKGVEEWAQRKSI